MLHHLKFYSVILLICLFSCRKSIQNKIIASSDNFIRGADLSFLPQLEAAGIQFYNQDSTAADMLSILKNKGCNTVRVRLWNQPTDGHSGLNEVIAFCEKIKQNNLKVWLDFHYSDNWADPAKQVKPTLWSSLTQQNLCDSVSAFTKRVMLQIQPDYVQIGNEINNGLLWENGRITNINNMVQLLNAGIKASRDASPASKIVIHYAGQSGSEQFYNTLKNNGVNYDIIGLSYYPIWHGFSLDSLSNSMLNLQSLFYKPIVIAETSYPFTFAWNDQTNNIIGLSSQILPEYPASPQGQLNYILKIKDIMQKLPNGQGFCYWGGEWVAFKGKNASDGSTWENQALFNFNNKALPVLDAFEK